MKKGSKKKEIPGVSEIAKNGSTEAILKKVAASIKREASKRSQPDSKRLSSAVLLDSTLLVKAGTNKLDATMSEEHATLKSLVQNLVKLELTKLLRNMKR